MAEQPRQLNRDLSWLAFNDRVLAQAEDTRRPLLERVKFLAISASNLDEFFMKRVGLAKRRLAEGRGRPKQARDGYSAEDLLNAMRSHVVEFQTRQASIWMGQLQPALAEAGVRICVPEDLTESQRARLDHWFDVNVFPILTPLAVDPSHRFPFISNLSENFGVLVRPEAGGPRTFARVKIPGVVRRFIPLTEAAGGEVGDTSGPCSFVTLEDLIARNLDRLFPGMQIEEITPFRITRSAAVAGEEDDDEDVLQAVEDELRRRRFARPVRLETRRDAPDGVLQFVTTQLSIEDADVYRREGPLEYEDLFELASIDRADLKTPDWEPVIPPALKHLAPIDPDAPDAVPPGESIFDRIRDADILVHHPYESFDHSVERFIQEAAADPEVLAIKQTIYRTTPDSPFVRSLVHAAERGKNVACLVELRARFDEQRNVSFARQLEHAGVHVAYGVTGLKTHCKCSLVVRRETTDGVAGIRAYAHLGTGNYHPKTAQLYTDVGLLTADPEITSDVVRIFNTLTGNASGQDYEKLLVAPERMRPGFIELIDREIEHARAGRPAHVVAKMNQLEDEAVIEKLYEASRAGVVCRLFVRGFCTMRPGVEGLSENIEVRSIVGRFLEHSRVFCFGSGVDPAEEPERATYYIGSADWMERNLSDRVEAAVPVESPVARRKLWRTFDTMIRDRRNAWRLGPSGEWSPVEADLDAPEGSPERDGTFMALMAEAEAGRR
ncbi:MAG: polyphosphate kinase 1 [Planctomycetota bacterium]